MNSARNYLRFYSSGELQVEVAVVDLRAENGRVQASIRPVTGPWTAVGRRQSAGGLDDSCEERARERSGQTLADSAAYDCASLLIRVSFHVV